MLVYHGTTLSVQKPKIGVEVMQHSTTRATILPTIIELITKEFKLDENNALDAFYRSATGASFADDETGLYGQSPLFIFGLYKCEVEEKEL